MRGWTILFALMAVAAYAMGFADPHAVVSAKGASVLFSSLFLLTLAAQVIRGRVE